VCYVIDEAYLFPTLVSAIQARGFSGPAAGVVIACIGARPPRYACVDDIAQANGVELIHVLPDAIDNMHVMFGRLFIDRFLPTRYERVLYIDGDTQVTGSLDPLLEATIPQGMFLACRDPSALFAESSAARQAKMRDYYRKLGVAGEPANYFNSGVLVVDRASWGPLAQAGAAVYRGNEALFLHPDQDALNVALGDRCRIISNKWNFPGFLIGSRAEAARQPHIYHFMSNPRPWKVSVGPWGARWSKPYADLLRAHPELKIIAPKRLIADQVRYAVQQQLKIWLQYRRVGRIAAEQAVYDLA
jgi:lipopolysaccharide biosynthesis glycosyltransferase